MDAAFSIRNAVKYSFGDCFISFRHSLPRVTRCTPSISAIESTLVSGIELNKRFTAAAWQLCPVPVPDTLHIPLG